MLSATRLDPDMTCIIFMEYKMCYSNKQTSCMCIDIGHLWAKPSTWVNDAASIATYEIRNVKTSIVM